MENGTRDIHSNYNQMKVYCEIICNRHFHQAIGEILKISEKFWLVLSMNFTSLTLSGHTENSFASIVCVHVENCSQNE